MPTPLLVRIAIWTWLIAAFAAGNSGLLQKLPPLSFPGLIFALTGLVLLVYFKTTALRAWMGGLDLRALVLLHVTRFVGVYFLILYQRGELPYAFAVPGGWGDIVVATLALGVCFVPMADATRTRAITIWNVIGLIDILMVVATAARLGAQDPNQMRALTVLPLCLLPTFLVPLIIATHVIIFFRLRRAVVSG